MKVDKLKATDDLHIDDMIRIFIYIHRYTLLHSSFLMMVVVLDSIDFVVLDDVARVVCRRVDWHMLRHFVCSVVKHR